MRTTPIWILNLLLALVVLGLAQRPVTIPDTGPPASGDNQYPQVRSLVAPPIEEYTVISARPLFNPDRRPAPAPVAPETQPDRVEPVPEAKAEPQPPTPPGGRLHGVISDGRSWTVLYQIKDQQEVRRLKPGQQVEGWSIVAVQPDAVVFAHGEFRHALPLRPDP